MPSHDPPALFARSLGRDGLVFTDFFIQLTRQTLEMAVAPAAGSAPLASLSGSAAPTSEKKAIPWLALPGYSLFVELYAPLLQAPICRYLSSDYVPACDPPPPPLVCSE